MSQAASPEKKKSRKSLSLSKKKLSRSPKCLPSPGNSKSPSIHALFKNAPPAKLSCPLCSEMVSRFGLNKHIDEECTKAKEEDLDVTVVDVKGPVRSELSCRVPQHTTVSAVMEDLTSTPCSQTEETSTYFMSNAPIKVVTNETDNRTVKTVPLGSLSSRLSRRYQTRSVKQDTLKRAECQIVATSTGPTTAETPGIQLNVPHKENVYDQMENQPQNTACKEKTAKIKKASMSIKHGEQSNPAESIKGQISHVLDDCPNSSYNDKYISQDEQVCNNIQAAKHKLDKNVTSKNIFFKKAKPGDSLEPAVSFQQCADPLSISSVKDTSELLPMDDLSVLGEFFKPFEDEDLKCKLETVGSESESASETGRHPYYLRNFLMVLQTVMENEEDMSLFSEEDICTLTSFHDLSAAGQKLYVRLFQRKLNWIKRNKIEYTEIGSDLIPVIDELVQNRFLQSDDELEELPEALDLLSAPELKTLAKSFHLTNPGAPKPQLVEEFLRLSKQKSVFSLSKKQPGISAVILKKAKTLTGRAVRVCRAPRAVFSRVLLLFSLSDSMEVEEAASGGQTQLSTVLMVNMGRMVFPEYTVNRITRIFQDRDDLIRYETAMHKLIDIVVAMTNGNWKEALLLYQSAGKIWDELKTDSSLRYHAELPVYLRCFTVGWVYTRILSRGVEILQRLHLYEEAVELLQSLLSQHTYCPDSRGRWWDRLALNLHQHLKSTQKAIGFIMEGLSDPYVRTGHQLSLYQRAIRMRESPSCKKFQHLFSDLPVIDVEDVPHVTIKGKMYPQIGMGKSIFLMEDLPEEVGDELTSSTVMCSVEELALAHYRSQGFDQGIHGEGSTFCTLYGLLMWDIIFMEDIPDVFRNSYQSFPLDLYTDSFFENRKDTIESRLQLLHESSSEELAQRIAEIWDAQEGKTAALVSWERFSSLQQAQSLVSCFGGPFLSGVCRKMSRDIRHCKGGLPDLVVWNINKKQYKLVEVKGPSDRLSHKQMVWLHELKKLGADVEVCHVVAIGAKSSRVA